MSDALRCAALLLGAVALLTAAVTAEALLGKGYADLRLQRYDAAVTDFRAALKLDPSLVVRARLPLGVALFELKQSAAARREFEAVRLSAGDSPKLAYYLGRLDLSDRNYPRAIRYLRKAAAQPPFSDTARYLGLACFRNGDPSEAEKWLLTALRINPHDDRAEYQLALLYKHEGRRADADRAFQRTADLQKNTIEERDLRNQCEARLEEGTPSAAHAVCDKLYDPGDPEKLTVLGALYEQHGDSDAASEYLSRAAELDPEAPRMQYNLAFAYYRAGKYAEAAGVLSQAVERWPDLFELEALYGAILANLGDVRGSYQALRHAHTLNAQDATVTERLYLATLALAQACQGDRQNAEALLYFKEAAAMKPHDPEPRQGIAAISGRR